MARRFTICLYCRHHGLDRLLRGLWAGHNVLPTIDYWGSEVDRNPKLNRGPFRAPTADVYVSTIAHHEFEPIVQAAEKWNKPLVAYITDPFTDEAKEWAERLRTKPWFHPIGCEPCYPPWVFTAVEEFIPYALDPALYPKYVGDIPKIAIVNREPIDRWRDAQRHEYLEPLRLIEYLEGLPFDIVQRREHAELREAYSRYKCLFHYSNSPYTIVMFEAMTVGMPIVAYNNKRFKVSVPRYAAEHYFAKHSTDREQIRTWLAEMLAAPAAPVTYPIETYADISNRWQQLFERIT